MPVSRFDQKPRREDARVEAPRSEWDGSACVAETVPTRQDETRRWLHSEEEPRAAVDRGAADCGEVTPLTMIKSPRLVNAVGNPLFSSVP